MTNDASSEQCHSLLLTRHREIGNALAQCRSHPEMTNFTMHRAKGSNTMLVMQPEGPT